MATGSNTFGLRKQISDLSALYRCLQKARIALFCNEVKRSWPNSSLVCAVFIAWPAEAPLPLHGQRLPGGKPVQAVDTQQQMARLGQPTRVVYTLGRLLKHRLGKMGFNKLSANTARHTVLRSARASSRSAIKSR